MGNGRIAEPKTNIERKLGLRTERTHDPNMVTTLNGGKTVTENDDNRTTPEKKMKTKRNAKKPRLDYQRPNGDGDGEGQKLTETETTTVMDRDGDKVLEEHGQPDRHNRKDEETDRIRQMARRNGRSTDDRAR